MRRACTREATLSNRTREATLSNRTREATRSNRSREATLSNRESRSVTDETAEIFIVRNGHSRVLFCIIAVTLLVSTSLVGPTVAQNSPAPTQRGAKPTVVVIANLANEEMAALLRDAITEKLVTSGRFDVVDRAHLQQILGEQATSAEGQVLAGSEAKVGRMVGANYMLIAKLTKLDSVMDRRGGVFSLNMYPKADMLSTVQVLQVRSGRIVRSIDDEQIAEGPGVPLTTQNQANETQFANSALRELLPKLAS